MLIRVCPDGMQGPVDTCNFRLNKYEVYSSRIIPLHNRKYMAVIDGIVTEIQKLLSLNS